MDLARRATNRFGLGARPGEAQEIDDPRGWLLAQLRGASPTLDDPQLPTPETIRRAVVALRNAQRSPGREGVAAARDVVSEIRSAEARAWMAQRTGTPRPFVERLVAFWSNHLCVSSVGKRGVIPFAGAYEREVIRPHVLGRFEEMVIASARHPAMLLYLDNAQSVGPTSRVGRVSERRGPRRRGLNENYARELMELHTVGVDGGYTQDDVTALARVFTGWTFVPATGFSFLPALHEPGAQVVRGARYAQEGMAQGEAIVRDLCASPAAARFVATKLVRHFVDDEPPAAAVDRVAATFTRTGGDLREVAATLVELPEAWEPARRKIRTPQDWLTAALRAVGDRPPRAGAPAGIPLEGPGVLTQLNQPLWQPPSPKGFGDTLREWSDSDSLMNRAELARTIANRRGRDADAAAVVGTVEVSPDDPLIALVTDESIDARERLALVLASPAFQWR